MRLSTVAALVLAAPTVAQFGDISDVKLLKPEDKQDAKSTPPPDGALVLFDGKNLDAWVRRNDPKKPAEWKLVNGGAVQVSGGGDIITKETFDGHFKLHVGLHRAAVGHHLQQMGRLGHAALAALLQRASEGLVDEPIAEVERSARAFRFVR